MKINQMTVWKTNQRGVCLGGLLLALALPAFGAALTAGTPILLENTKGNFDFIRIDNSRHRLLLAHTGNKTLDVFDLDAKRLLKSVATGAAQDAAVDVKRGRYYASVSAPPRLRPT
ncbi:MAG: hypothetical protein NTW03_07995 [Verrucomicrobia bacterium]|nr:hypothetical protein [Verrucomicrobiota bacterium]